MGSFSNEVVLLCFDVLLRLTLTRPGDALNLVICLIWDYTNVIDISMEREDINSKIIKAGKNLLFIIKCSQTVRILLRAGPVNPSPNPWCDISPCPIIYMQPKIRITATCVTLGPWSWQSRVLGRWPERWRRWCTKINSLRYILGVIVQNHP